MKHTMKKSHIEELKYLKSNNDYFLGQWLLEPEQRIRLRYLQSLRKIIKLKSSNRILCAKRKVLLYRLYNNKDKVVLSTFITCHITQISEQIGKNTYKIQKLRTEYKQLEKQFKSRI
jgi:hypothetical protein